MFSPSQSTNVLKMNHLGPYFFQTRKAASSEEQRPAKEELGHSSSHCPTPRPRVPKEPKQPKNKEQRWKFLVTLHWFRSDWLNANQRLDYLKASTGVSCQNTEFWGSIGWCWAPGTAQAEHQPLGPCPGGDPDLASWSVQDSLGTLGCKQLRLPNFPHFPNRKNWAS